MDHLQWSGPFLLRDYLGQLLEMTGSVWPPSRAGVYVITSEPWANQPTPGNVLYTGATGNLLGRIGDLIRDVLGFYGPVDDKPEEWIGAHSGGQSLWANADADFPVGELVLGWAATPSPCHWCVERELARLLKPSLNKRCDSGRCCCPVSVG